MRKLRRTVLWLVVISLSMLSFFISPKEARAVSEGDIKEIGTNIMVEDVFESYSDVKYYKFTMDKTGYFDIAFNVPGIDVKEHNGWIVTLLDSDGNSTIYSFTVFGNTTLPKVPFVKGKTCYLKMKLPNSSPSADGVNYQFQVNTYEVTNWEVEYNDSMETANNICADVTYCGNLMSSNDTDYYHFVMDRAGYFNISFSIPEVGANVQKGWKLSVYVEDRLVHSFTLTSNATMCPYAFREGTNIYVKVEAEYKDSVTAPRYTEYNLKVNGTTSSLWEQESNDSISAASVMNLGEIYSGSIYQGEDVDYYKVTTTQKGFLTILLDPNNLAENLGDGYALNVYASDNTQLYSLSSITAVSNIRLYLNKGDYYIRIGNNNEYRNPGIYNVYKLSATSAVAGKPGKAKVKSVKGTTYYNFPYTCDNLTYKLNSVKDAHGYQIQISTSKKFNKNKTTIFYGQTGTIGSNLLKKKRYYIRARAYYETPLGEKTYGKWSSVKSAKTK